MITQFAISDAVPSGPDQKGAAARMVASLLTKANLAFAQEGAAGCRVTRVEVIEDNGRCQVTLESVRDEDRAATPDDCRKLFKEGKK